MSRLRCVIPLLHHAFPPPEFVFSARAPCASGSARVCAFHTAPFASSSLAVHICTTVIHRIFPDRLLLLANQFVVALSANTDSTDVAKTFEVGFDFFYPKPIKVPDLLKHLDGKYMDDSVVKANYPALTSK